MRRPSSGIRQTRVAALVIAALVLAGCASGDDTAKPTTSAPDTSVVGSSTVTTAESAKPADDFTVVNLNVLHGNPIAAPGCADNDNCFAPERVAMLLDAVEAAGCPDAVTLQELDERVAEVLAEQVPGTCDGAYDLHLVVNKAVTLGIDQPAILTRVPVREETLVDLPAFPWAALHLTLDTDIGVVDLVTTHLASSSNNPACDIAGCPTYCAPTDDAKTCGARQILDHLGTVGGDGLWVVTGDLNSEPTSPIVRLFVDAGFVDTHLAAHNPECVPTPQTATTPADETAVNPCTSGRSETDLADPAARGIERIDYVLVRPSARCTPTYDADADGDGVRTSTWIAEPREPTGAHQLVWPSDHNGTQADIACG